MSLQVNSTGWRLSRDNGQNKSDTVTHTDVKDSQEHDEVSTTRFHITVMSLRATVSTQEGAKGMSKICVTQVCVCSVCVFGKG